jgi:ABC-2 type transport system ATP-binding protein
MTDSLETLGLAKQYRSGFTLGPISMKVRSGEVLGIVGVNGSGKTTLLRLLAGVLRPTGGRIQLAGKSHTVVPASMKQWLGHMDEEHILYDWMSARQLERFLKPFFPTWDSGFYAWLLLDLEIPDSRTIGQLSKGNKAKLALATVLARKPRILLLDEPTDGMDPRVRRTVLEAIDDYVFRESGTSVLISSHITSDLERICDRIVVLSQGSVQAEFDRSQFSPITHARSLEDRILQFTS